jgi:hypothetical protein
MEEMTFRQEDFIRKSLFYAGRQKAIKEFCINRDVSWTDLTKEDASLLIDSLS